MNYNNAHLQEPYEVSESNTYDEGEQFADEPQQHGRDPAYHDQQPYPVSHEDQYDDLRYDNGEPFQDHDPYSQQQDQQLYPEDGVVHDDNYVDQEREQAPIPEPVEPRKHKYSTANMQETGKKKKWCYIVLMFLLFLAFMIGLSMLFNHFFFSDQSDNGPQTNPRPENTTFPKDKHEIDSACSRGSIVSDQGALCTEACVPQFFKCCDPFNELELYNYTESANGTNSATNEMTTAENTTFLDGYENFNDTNCTFDLDLRGCMSYAKCQALGGQADPAPATLPDICSFARLAKDDGSCKDLCQKLDCCFSSGSDNCMADKFDICMDYAPCQNLRSLENITDVLETAPRTLDFDCFMQKPSCADTCELARCCTSDAANSCFQNNFMSCLTYSPCTENTDVDIAVAPQFNQVSKPPDEIVYACNAHHEAVLMPTTKSCNDYCEEAACCWESDPTKNCFQNDPLGCLAWDAQCQVLLA